MAPKGSNMAILRSWKNKKGKERSFPFFAILCGSAEDLLGKTAAGGRTSHTAQSSFPQLKGNAPAYRVHHIDDLIQREQVAHALSLIHIYVPGPQ